MERDIGILHSEVLNLYAALTQVRLSIFDVDLI